MFGCLTGILSHLAFSFLVAIMTKSFVIGGIYFFLPVIFVVVYFLFHKEEGKLFLKKVGPLLLIGGITFLLCSVMVWQNFEKEKDEKAMKLYYRSSSIERDLGECRNKLPQDMNFDNSFYHNAQDEMIGMAGKSIIGDLEYGMSPRDVFDIGDSLEVSQCSEISVGKIKPNRKYYPMFNSMEKLYGIQLEYYYAWKRHEDYDGQIEANLKEVIDNLSKQYGEPTVNFRNDIAYHVKWNHENQAVHWYTEIDEHTMVSQLYIYLPWTYRNAFK